MSPDFNDIMNSLSENARFAFQKADLYAKRYGNGYVSSEHILLGILAQENSTGAKYLREAGLDLHSAESFFGEEEHDVDRPAGMAMMSISEACILILRMAQNLCYSQGLTTIGTEHLLYAILTQPNSYAIEVLEYYNIDIDDLLDRIEALCAHQAETAKVNKQRKKFERPKAEHRWLSRYGLDLTDRAKNGELDAVIGREQEIERTITVLCRRTKSNPVLIGEAGVGKTAIVEGLAQKIVKNDVPGILVGKHIYQIDLSSMVAGTKFRGEFEERIKGVIDEATSDPDVILFIDELHLLNGAGSGEGTMDAANILKPALARGKLSLIGATTMDEYRKYIEKDHALSRRFQTVIVEEPSDLITLRILKGVKKHYEKHHGVEISDRALELAINMSGRYINDRYMPDKAIDVIDEACAIAKVEADKKGGGEYKKLKIEQATLESQIDDAVEKEDYEKAANYKTKLAKLTEEIKKLEKKGANKKSKLTPALKESHLATAISLKTGIPVSKVHGSELKLLINLEQELKKSVIGQNEAITAVAKAIRRGRSGVADSRRPIGSFLFMGPTGVGKTELARVIAREVFGGDNSLIKIDMSEFGEKHNVSRLVGAPAGYVGYDDGGKLTEAIRRHPYSVVLFDEIEKAHPEVFNILLQILEDGTLTDGQGNKIKFNNSVIILTSNLGASDMYRSSEMGFSATSPKEKAEFKEEYEASKAAARKALEKTMRPELINRLDSIQVFHALTRANVEKIFDNLIEELRRRLAIQNVSVKVDDKAKDRLIEIGYDPKNGARPLRRAIEDNIESLLSEAIISGILKKGQVATIKLTREKTFKLVVEHE